MKKEKYPDPVTSFSDDGLRPILRRVEDDKPCEGCIHLGDRSRAKKFGFGGTFKWYCLHPKALNERGPLSPPHAYHTQEVIFLYCPGKVLAKPRETFTLADLVAEKCPREGIEFFLQCDNAHIHGKNAVEWAREMLRKHNKPACWFKWFSDHIAPAPELKEIELFPIMGDSIMADCPDAVEAVAVAAYNKLLEIATGEAVLDVKAHESFSWARRIITDILAKHGLEVKGW